jgi:hypothetical protein
MVVSSMRDSMASTHLALKCHPSGRAGKQTVLPFVSLQRRHAAVMLFFSESVRIKDHVQAKGSRFGDGKCRITGGSLADHHDDGSIEFCRRQLDNSKFSVATDNNQSMLANK